MPHRRWHIVVLLMSVLVTPPSRLVPLSLNVPTRDRTVVIRPLVLRSTVLSLDKLSLPLAIAARTVYLPERVPRDPLYAWYPHRAAFRLSAVLLE